MVTSVGVVIKGQILSADAQAPAEVMQVPVRWCWVDGSPSLENPSLVGEKTAHDVLWRKHERISDQIYIPETSITFRSGYPAAIVPPTFKEIADPIPTIGDRGDIQSVPGTTEWQTMINSCRAAWQNDKNTAGVIGITAVSLNNFVNADGFNSGVLGRGGIPNPLSNTAVQVAAGRATVQDSTHQMDICVFTDTGQDAWPVLESHIFGHEMGHALGLFHGNGLDDDFDGAIDEDEDGIGGPDEEFNQFATGPGGNLMQYQDYCDMDSSNDITNGNFLSQESIIRDQVILHIEDATTGSLSGLVKPLGEMKVDQVNEIPNEKYIDIDAIQVAVENRKSSTTFGLTTFGLIPTLPPGEVDYYFLVDLDNNNQTGAVPQIVANNLGINTQFTGIEFVGQVKLIPFGHELGTGYTINPKAWIFQNGTFVNVTQPGAIKAEVLEDKVIDDTFTNGSTTIPIANIVNLIVSDNARGLITTDAVRMETISENKATGTRDDQNGVGNEFRLVPPDFPVCSVEPNTRGLGGDVVVHAKGLVPNSDTHTILGDDEVATGRTDSTGSTFMAFEVPLNSTLGPRLVTVGTGALTADCILDVVPPELDPNPEEPTKPHQTISSIAQCDSGDTVLSGSFVTNGSAIIQSFKPLDTLNGWNATAIVTENAAGGGNTGSVTADAECFDNPPPHIP
jgi:hypothetical protein